MRSVVVFHREDVNSDTSAKKVFDTVSDFVKAIGRDPNKQVLHREKCEASCLSELTEVPRLLILHVTNAELGKFENEVLKKIDETGQVQFPRIYVTNGASPEIEDWYGGWPCVEYVYDLCHRLRDLLDIWKEESFAPKELKKAWERVRFRQSTNAERLIHSLATLDILLQGYLAIHSDGEEWSAIRNLPSVAQNHDAAIGQTDASRLWRPVTVEMQSMLSKMSPELLVQSNYWFDPVLLEIFSVPGRDRPKTLLAFTTESDQFLNGLGAEVTKRGGWLNSEEQSRIQCILFPRESEQAAMSWANYLAAQKLNSLPSGGALRFCWELVRRGGHFAGLNAPDVLRPVQLCALFETAHEEYLECCKFLSRLHHDARPGQ
jgi:hypothetical protein